jgi:hypothetical protein
MSPVPKGQILRIAVKYVQVVECETAPDSSGKKVLSELGVRGRNISTVLSIFNFGIASD